MGTKYSSNSISGYNATPPADDGTVSEANKTKWSTVKTKLTDPVKTLAETINSELATHFNNGPTALTSNTTLGATHYNQVIEVSGSGVTLTLTDASTLGAGWFCEINNTDSSNNITLTGATTADTCNGVAFSTQTYTLRPGFSAKVVVNAAANGFLVTYETLNKGSDGAVESIGVNGGSKVNWVPRNWISGLKCQLDPDGTPDTEHDIQVTAGECADSGNAYILKHTAQMVKQIDATWAAGDDAGGMRSGDHPVSNSTSYFIYLIRKDSDGTIDVIFSSETSSPTLPAGYTAHAQVGAFRTDASGNIETIGYFTSPNVMSAKFTFSSLGSGSATSKLLLLSASDNISGVTCDVNGDSATESDEWAVVICPGAAIGSTLREVKFIGDGNLTLAEISTSGGLSGGIYVNIHNYASASQTFIVNVTIFLQPT